MVRPMPMDPAFVADCPYGPGAILLDELLEVDAEKERIRVRMPTHDDLPITRDQRAHPTRHPRHVSGGLMIHATAIAAFAHAYYVLGLRHSDGWIGYGGRIYSARFHVLVKPGEPLDIECTSLQSRRGDRSVVERYAFRFAQGSTHVFDSEQSALWTRIAES